MLMILHFNVEDHDDKNIFVLVDDEDANCCIQKNVQNYKFRREYRWVYT
jgi:hypothetical protein